MPPVRVWSQVVARIDAGDGVRASVAMREPRGHPVWQSFAAAATQLTHANVRVRTGVRPMPRLTSQNGITVTSRRVSR